jgi:hypothetical protein
VTLVKVRCWVPGCGKLLADVDWAPAEGDELTWSTLVFIPVCPRHGGGRGSVAKWASKRRRAGLPDDRVAAGRWAYWAELRPAVQAARRTGRTQTHVLSW